METKVGRRTSLLGTKQAAVIFGRNLRAARIAANLTQEELEKISGVPRTGIGLYENGRRYISLHTIVKFALALKIPAGVFFKDI